MKTPMTADELKNHRAKLTIELTKLQSDCAGLPKDSRNRNNMVKRISDLHSQIIELNISIRSVASTKCEDDANRVRQICRKLLRAMINSGGFPTKETRHLASQLASNVIDTCEEDYHEYVFEEIEI